MPWGQCPARAAQCVMYFLQASVLHVCSTTLFEVQLALAGFTKLGQSNLVLSRAATCTGNHWLPLGTATRRCWHVHHPRISTGLYCAARCWKVQLVRCACQLSGTPQPNSPTESFKCRMVQWACKAHPPLVSLFNIRDVGCCGAM